MLLTSLIHDYFDSFSGKQKTRESVSAYVADESLFQHIEIFEKGFPLYQVKAEDIIEQGDRVAVRVLFTGTHSGEFNGIPATGKTVQLPFIVIYRFEGGKIAEHWLEANHLALLAQLGVMSTEATPV
jgi:predicted ester cyclase